jgi:hypothetical protein
MRRSCRRQVRGPAAPGRGFVLGEQGGGFRRQALLAAGVGGFDEGLEERVRFEGPGLEFGVELAAEEPGVAGEFADFDELAAGPP